MIKGGSVRFLLLEVFTFFVFLQGSLSAKELSLFSHKDVINNAVSIIKHELPEDSNKAYSIQTRYKMTKDNKAISVETKLYFSDYHKKPQRICKSFDVKDTSVSKVIEVIYNRKQDRNHVILLEKKPGKTKNVTEKKNA